MKQRDLLFAGLMLLAAPAFAQIDAPEFDESRDAKVVFTQTFEGNWETWSTTPVDSITKVEYYKNKGTSNSASLKPWENPNDWQRGIFRDSLIYLKNGVVICDNTKDQWNEKDNTAGTIVNDSGQEKADRANAMKAFGEADGGGNSYFKFTTDSAPKKYGTNDYSTDTEHAARYRRNLFVRGLDVEPHSSYRLTFYVKGKARAGHPEVSPYMVADVMRGYFHAEKPFSMGYINDANNYKYTRKFEYDKDLFNGDWEKCTFMTYYINDTVANNYVFVDGYWWAEDSSWFWAKGYKGNNSGSDLYYHVQPNKFFVRLGFSSNYSEFCVDNMSLTRSYIGGVEYYQHMLRVDFGYKTNLKDLAKEAYSKTKIDAVEIPGIYFDVWGLKADGTWEYTDIASAEYQGDGYMYLFADGYEKDGEFIHYTFDQYKKVLVSFYNPSEPELQLKYTGDMFPKADDIEWIKAGKLVENFYNEEAHLNPYVFADVYSMYDRPPVMQKAQYEDGSFGLDGSIRSITFKFSREMEIDNPANAETRTKCVVYVGDETWDRTWNAGDSTLTITRPSKYSGNLTGDKVIELNNLYIPNTSRKAEDVAIHYNFGEINRDLSSVSFGAAVWDAKFYDETVNPNDAGTATKPLSPNGTAIWWNKESGWSRQRTFQVLDGKTELNAARLYRYTDSTLTNLRALAICPRNDASVPAKFYLGYSAGFDINLTAGNYVLQYKAQPINKLFGFKVYVYPWVEDPRTVEDGDKLLVAEHNKFDRYFVEALMKSADNNVDTILINEFKDGFQVEKSGKYLIEIHVDPAANGDTGYPSMLFSNFELFNSPVSFGPISVLNDAVTAAQARATLAADAKYAGAALTALNGLIDQYKIGGTFTSSKPSDWQNAAKATVAATDEMKLRMDTVDLVVAKAKEVADKITSAAADNANWAQLIDYTTLTGLKATYDAYPFSTKANADLTAFIKEMDDAIKALDARIADTKQFNIAMQKAKALIDAKEKESFTEYGDLKDAYEDKEDFDTLQTADADLQAALAEVSEATEAYRLAVGIFNVGTRRIKELDKLAKDLGSTIGDSAVVKELFTNLTTDDDYLADIYKAAIKAAIYEKGAAAGELNLSPFLKNYYLYATPIVAEEMGVQMPATRGNLKYDEKRHGNANVGHTKHQYQSDLPIWIILTQHDFTNLIPGWTVNAGDGGGNDMTFLASMRNDSIYKDAVFDATLAMDWGGEVALSTKIMGLPAGEYELGLDIRSQYSNGQKTSKGTGELNVKFDTLEFSAKTVTEYLAPEYTIVERDTLPGVFDTIAYTGDGDSTVFNSVKFEVGDNKVVEFNASMKTGNGAAEYGDFKMTFKPSATFDYAAAAAEAKADVAKVITVVDFAKAQKNNVEFYTLGGLKVDGAKAGQILIRKTTNANGKVVFDKVMLK